MSLLRNLLEQSLGDQINPYFNLQKKTQIYFIKVSLTKVKQGFLKGEHLLKIAYSQSGLE